MKHPPLILALWAILLVLPAQAQKGDWQTVKNLPSGTPISVQYGRFFIHMRCIFQKANDEHLICERMLHGPSVLLIPPEVTYERRGIREVRLEHSEASNMAVGAAIGAGVGAAMGAAGSGDTHAQARVAAGLIFGGAGALVGGFMGRDFPIRHGKVIYRQ